LLGRLVLPGVLAPVGLGSAAEGAALDLARGPYDGWLVAVPPHPGSRPYRGNGTLVKIVRADPAIGPVSDAEVRGVRRVHIASLDTSGPVPHVVVTKVAAAPLLNTRQGKLLGTLIAEARGNGCPNLDPAGDPEEQVDRLAVCFVTASDMHLAVLNAPTLEGRLRHLSRVAAQRRVPSPRPGLLQDAAPGMDEDARLGTPAAAEAGDSAPEAEDSD
jgi:hypothetical protein